MPSTNFVAVWSTFAVFEPLASRAKQLLSWPLIKRFTVKLCNQRSGTNAVWHKLVQAAQEMRAPVRVAVVTAPALVIIGRPSKPATRLASVRSSGCTSSHIFFLSTYLRPGGETGGVQMSVSVVGFGLASNGSLVDSIS